MNLSYKHVILSLTNVIDDSVIVMSQLETVIKARETNVVLKQH